MQQLIETGLGSALIRSLGEAITILIYWDSGSPVAGNARRRSLRAQHWLNELPVFAEIKCRLAVRLEISVILAQMFPVFLSLAVCWQKASVWLIAVAVKHHIFLFRLSIIDKIYFRIERSIYIVTGTWGISPAAGGNNNRKPRRQAMPRVKDKTILITGAANGLGSAMAKLLASEGAVVWLTDIDDTSGNAVVAEINSAGGRAQYMRQDVSLPEEWDRVFFRLRANHARLDVLVNNAGGGTYNDIETVSFQEWRRIMALNLDSSFLGTQMAIKWMKQTGGGSIVNVSSIAAFIGSPNLAAYCAAKAGIYLLSKSAAVYCGQKGYQIRVNSIHPGLVDTRAGKEMARLATGLPTDEEAIAAFTAMHPIGRIGKPDDIANGVLYLASDESSFVTGTHLIIDGGFTAV